MPVSKRDKKISLTKTTKKGMTMKQRIVEDIRKFLEKYDNLFVFTTNNMRNGPLKTLREEWDDSRFFFAKKKVMAVALGRTEADEIQKNIHKIASYLVGQCGLFFTNRPKEEVLQWFRDFSQMEFAKSGFVATETVTLPAGPLTEFSFALEPHLRSLGLPTQLEKGKIILREDYTVCTQGSKLTPEQASILKLFGKQMAEFKIKIVCMWSKDGAFEKFKVAKEAKKLTKSSENSLKPKKEKRHEPHMSEKENKEAGEEMTQMFALQTINESNNNEKNKLTQPEIVEEIMDGENEKPPKPEVSRSRAKQSEKKESKKTVQAEMEKEPNLQDETETLSVNEVPKQVEESPKITRATPRRSLRTPKPIRRSPEEKKESVKKLTESQKKAKSAKVTKPVKSTPRKSVSKKIFEEPEDVEMAE